MRSPSIENYLKALYKLEEDEGTPVSTSDLAQAMGCSWDEIHEEVEILKHHISERFEDRIDHVADEDGDLLEQRGLLPGATVEVLETCPLDGLLIVAVGGSEQLISRPVARKVVVET